MIQEFRAWNKATKEKHEADDIVSLNFEEKQICVKTLFFGQLNYYDFDDIVLMQSTGLKDKNGKEIFEGDVVTFEDEIRCGDDLDIFLNIGVVEYGQGMFYISNRQSVCADDLLDGEMWDVEVIGNIYENTELIE